MEMIPWQEQFEDLLQALENCRLKQEERISFLECCFGISLNASFRLLHEVSNRGFSNSREEIFFFKKVKPKFEAEVEYFRLLYHAELFKPVFKVDQKEFWQRELERFEKFISGNREFYEYYSSDKVHNDEVYFKKINGTVDASDLKYGIASTHDHLVAKIIALKRYCEYVELELSQSMN